MLTCLCDAYFGEVGIATVRALEHVGCEVVFLKNQTCCGQPAFNSGSWADARKVALHCRSVLFSDENPVVAPSSSCIAMVRDGYLELFEGGPSLPGFELAQFLVNELGVRQWLGARPYPHKVAFHRACHGRGIGLTDEQEVLLRSIPGIELVAVRNPEQCCGFGGAFCATQGKLSSEIGLEKLRTVLETGATELTSGDMGCLMHLQGLIERHNMPLRVRHFAEILAEVIGP